MINLTPLVNTLTSLCFKLQEMNELKRKELELKERELDLKDPPESKWHEWLNG